MAVRLSSFDCGGVILRAENKKKDSAVRSLATDLGVNGAMTAGSAFQMTLPAGTRAIIVDGEARPFNLMVFRLNANLYALPRQEGWPERLNGEPVTLAAAPRLLNQLLLDVKALDTLMYHDHERLLQIGKKALLVEAPFDLDDLDIVFRNEQYVAGSEPPKARLLAILPSGSVGLEVNLPQYRGARSGGRTQRGGDERSDGSPGDLLICPSVDRFVLARPLRNDGHVVPQRLPAEYAIDPTGPQLLTDLLMTLEDVTPLIRANEMLRNHR